MVGSLNCSAPSGVWGAAKKESTSPGLEGACYFPSVPTSSSLICPVVPRSGHNWSAPRHWREHRRQAAWREGACNGRLCAQIMVSNHSFPPHQPTLTPLSPGRHAGGLCLHRAAAERHPPRARDGVPDLGSDNLSGLRRIRECDAPRSPQGASQRSDCLCTALSFGSTCQSSMCYRCWSLLDVADRFRSFCRVALHALDRCRPI